MQAIALPNLPAEKHRKVESQLRDMVVRMCHDDIEQFVEKRQPLTHLVGIVKKRINLLYINIDRSINNNDNNAGHWPNVSHCLHNGIKAERYVEPQATALPPYPRSKNGGAKFSACNNNIRLPLRNGNIHDDEVSAAKTCDNQQQQSVTAVNDDDADRMIAADCDDAHLRDADADGSQSPSPKSSTYEQQDSENVVELTPAISCSNNLVAQVVDNRSPDNETVSRSAATQQGHFTRSSTKPATNRSRLRRAGVAQQLRYKNGTVVTHCIALRDVDLVDYPSSSHHYHQSFVGACNGFSTIAAALSSSSSSSSSAATDLHQTNRMYQIIIGDCVDEVFDEALIDSSLPNSNTLLRNGRARRRSRNARQRRRRSDASDAGVANDNDDDTGGSNPTTTSPLSSSSSSASYSRESPPPSCEPSPLPHATHQRHRRRRQNDTEMLAVAEHLPSDDVLLQLLETQFDLKLPSTPRKRLDRRNLTTEERACISTNKYPESIVRYPEGTALIHRNMLRLIKDNFPGFNIDAALGACEFCEQQGFVDFWAASKRFCSPQCRKRFARTCQLKKINVAASAAAGSSAKSRKRKSGSGVADCGSSEKPRVSSLSSSSSSSQKSKIQQLQPALYGATIKRESKSSLHNSEHHQHYHQRNGESSSQHKSTTVQRPPQQQQLSSCMTPAAPKATTTTPTTFSFSMQVMNNLEGKEVDNWTTDDVAHYVAGCVPNLGVGVPKRFIEDAIDGKALVLLNTELLTVSMSIPLGHALKINNAIEMLKKSGKANMQNLRAMQQQQHQQQGQEQQP